MGKYGEIVFQWLFPFELIVIVPVHHSAVYKGFFSQLHLLEKRLIVGVSDKMLSSQMPTTALFLHD
jgi:hypothetical protein